VKKKKIFREQKNILYPKIYFKDANPAEGCDSKIRFRISRCDSNKRFIAKDAIQQIIDAIQKFADAIQKIMDANQ